MIGEGLMNSMKEIWMKGLSRTGWAGVLTAVFCVSNCSIAPLYGEDSEAATRQYNVAVSLQNREAYDLAIDAWAGFIKTYPTDSRVTMPGITRASVIFSRPSVRSIPNPHKPMRP